MTSREELLPTVPTHVVDFDGLAIAYDDAVLEPRAWTVAQARWAIECSADLPPGPVLELFAGVGHIGLAVSRATGRALVQVDASPAACDFARANARVAGLATTVRCGSISDVTDELGTFPLVLADPPYVPTAEVDALPDDPARAVDGGDDGLDLARQGLAVAARLLDPDGRLLLQLADADQVTVVGSEAPRWELEAVEHRVYDRGALLLLRPCGRTGRPG